MGCPAAQPGTVTPGLSKVPALCQTGSLAVSPVPYFLAVFFYFSFISPSAPPQWKFHMSCFFSKTKGYETSKCPEFIAALGNLVFILEGLERTKLLLLILLTSCSCFSGSVLVSVGQSQELIPCPSLSWDTKYFHKSSCHLFASLQILKVCQHIRGKV